MCKKAAVAKEGTTLEIWGEGKEFRSFCFVEDSIEAIYTLANSDYPYPINIGSDKPLSMLDLAKKVIKASGKNLTVSHKLEGVELGVKGRRCDSTKAYDILNWKPKVSLDEGIKITYDWIFNHIKEFKTV